jgi:tellurite resistance protein TerC
VLFYVSLAIIFGLSLGQISGWEYGQQFFAGYITELSLSVDNLFVFLVLLTSFAVPKEFQHRILMLGIVIALVLRGVLIALGAAVINAFSWSFYLFGAFLLFTAVQVIRHRNDHPEPSNNPLFKLVKRVISTTEDYDEGKFFTRIDGKRFATPMLVVILAIGTTDLLFALDSIPAIYGLTEEPFIVMTANAFALLGLRQLFFVISGLVERLIYLSFGLAFILGFIGVKLVLHAMAETPSLNWEFEIPLQVSLLVIGLTLAITTAASLLRTRQSNTKVGK